MKKKLIIFMVLCFALLQKPTTIYSAKATTKTKKFSYDRFVEGKDSSSFEFSGSSSIDQRALQLTPDNENQENGYNNKSGRIMYHQPYKLWSSDRRNDDVIASFTTNFVINMYRNEAWDRGEGLAFLIAPGYDLPNESHGQWLGLTNATADGDPGNRMVAVEFDTKKQGFDPIGSHVGLNINSVVSSKTVPMEFEPITNHSVWIE
ncbi:Lectin [Trema orientale]|uniref:Lectin n=1 Tax=Trema orientale TaxID=63057 RepID=A0A2P5BHQ7_TREOI|nr:Lectin [Trema orientale]